MDYEKKYKEALERAEALIAGETNTSDTLFYLNDIKSIFPELKESENEKMMNQLHSWMKEFGGAEEYTEKVYQWIKGLLEKQGEQKPTQEIEPTPIFKIGDILKRKGKDYTFRVDRIQGGYYHCDRNHGAFFPIEEQDNWELVEQKSNRVEPKFGIESGKWYICISQYFNCIEGQCYQALSNGRIIDDFGTEYDMHSDADKYFRLWTIQDAKGGDVLICGNQTFLFKCIEEKQVYCYGYIWRNEYKDLIGFQFLNQPNQLYCYTDAVMSPATKEQRDTLFAKMKEAGYLWDAEKKELKEIDAKKNLTLDGDLMQADCMIVEQKPAWNEDDEEMLNDAIGAIYAADYYTYDDKQEIENWLKSLKDRI